MTWQQIMVLLVVGASSLYLAHRAWQTWRGSGEGCGKGCACPTKAEDNKPVLIPVESIGLRMRQASLRDR